jgi:outer membrane protein insertion porin family
MAFGNFSRHMQWSLRLRALFLASFVLLLAGPALAQSVVVQGNKRVETDTIRSYVVGVNPEQAQKDLLATGLFSSVTVSPRGGTIVVTVKENEVVNRVAFEGNRKLKSEQLKDQLQTKARGPFSQAMVDADVALIKEIYQRSGRGQAQVSARVVPLENGRVDVVFTIVEGAKTNIKSIEFVGNHAFSGGKLRDQMATTEANFLSWLKTSDIYDPDKLASDQELLRRFYLKNGYADFRIVSADVQFDPAQNGYRIVITVDEGQQYRVSSVNIDSKIAELNPDLLRSKLRTSAGDVYDAVAVERSLQGLTTEVASRGYAFAQVRPRGDKDPASATIAITYIIEEGPRVYIERINVRGNTRTRDYVIRREFEIGEGDAYNKVLMDKAERRLNNLGYFKSVRVTNEPGSTPDRVIVNVDVEDQATGSFSISGGYSTADGFIAEVSVAETNFLGRGQYVKLSGSYGQYTKGIEFSFTEPYFLERRMAAGFDVFWKESDNTRYSFYNSSTYGGTLRLGLPITDEVSLLLRYSLYQSKLTIPNTASQPFNDCSYPINGITPGTPGAIANPNVFGPDGNPLPGNLGNPAHPADYVGPTSIYPGCLYNGEASLAIKQAQGTQLTSLVGYTLNYNTLDNNRNPRAGLFAELRQDFAGLGGDSHFIRTTGEVRYYREITDDFVGMLKGQAGYIWGNDLRVMDNFFMGPNLVRGFAPAGIGPRDQANPYRNALGGTTYFGVSAEVQFPLFGIPREFGLKGAVFADAGTLFGYNGKTNFSTTGQPCNYGLPGYGNYSPYSYPNCVSVWDDKVIRTSVGGSILWQSPLGPLRFDYAIPITKGTYDQTQYFRFSGGTSF